MMKKIFMLVILTGGLLFSSAAFADCFDECMSIKNCWHKGQSHSSYCGSAEVNCESECERKEERAKQKSYGAIAYSIPDRGYGFSDGLSDRKDAEKVAMDYCRPNGKKCKPIMWFQNSCGSVAADRKKVGWARASTDMEAQEKALKMCKKKGGKNCQSIITHCAQ